MRVYEYSDLIFDKKVNKHKNVKVFLVFIKQLPNKFMP